MAEIAFDSLALCTCISVRLVLLSGFVQHSHLQEPWQFGKAGFGNALLHFDVCNCMVSLHRCGLRTFAVRHNHRVACYETLQRSTRNMEGHEMVFLSVLCGTFGVAWNSPYGFARKRYYNCWVKRECDGPGMFEMFREEIRI